MSKLARRSHETSDSHVKNAKENTTITTDGASTKRADVPSRTARIFYAPHKFMQRQLNETSLEGRTENVALQEKKHEKVSLEDKAKDFPDLRKILDAHPSTATEIDALTEARERSLKARIDTAHPEREDIDRIKTPYSKLVTQAEVDQIKQPEFLNEQYAKRAILAPGMHTDETRQGVDKRRELYVQEMRIKLADHGAAYELKSYEKQCQTSKHELKELESDYKLHEQATKSQKELPWERFQGLKDSESYKEVLELQIKWQGEKQEYFEARSKYENLTLQDPIKNLKKEITHIKAKLLLAEVDPKRIDPDTQKQIDPKTLEKNKAAREAELSRLNSPHSLDKPDVLKELEDHITIARFEADRTDLADEVKQNKKAELTVLLERKDAITNYQKHELEKTKSVKEAEAQIKSLEAELAKFQKDLKRPKEQKESQYKIEPKDLQSQLKELPGYHETDPKKKRHGSPKHFLVFRDSLAEREAKSRKRIRERVGSKDNSADKLIAIYDKELKGLPEVSVKRYYTDRAIEDLDKPRRDKLSSLETIKKYEGEPKVRDLIDLYAKFAADGSTTKKVLGSVRYTFSRESRRKAREVIRFRSHEKGLEMSRQAYDADRKAEEDNITHLKDQTRSERVELDKNIQALTDAIDKKNIEILYRSDLDKGLLNSLEERPDFKKLNNHAEQQLLEADRAQMEAARAYLEQKRSQLEAPTLEAQIYAKNLEMKIADLDKRSELNKNGGRTNSGKIDDKISLLKNDREEFKEDLIHVKNEFRAAQEIIDKNVKLKDKIKSGAYEENVNAGLKVAEKVRNFEQHTIEHQQTEEQKAQERHKLETQKEEVANDLKQNATTLKELQKQNPNKPEVIAESNDLLLSTQQLKQKEKQLTHALAPEHKKEQIAEEQQALYSDQIKEIDEKVAAHQIRKADGQIPQKEITERDTALAELAIARKALEIKLDVNKNQTEPLHKDLQDLLHKQLDAYSTQLASLKSAEVSGLRDKLQNKIEVASKQQKSSVEQSILERGGELLSTREFTTKRISLERELERKNLQAEVRQNFEQQLKSLVDYQQERLNVDISIKDRAVKVAGSHYRQDILNDSKKDLHHDALEARNQLKIDEHLVSSDKDKQYADLEKLVKQQIKVTESNLSKLTEDDSTNKKTTLQAKIDEWKQSLAQDHLETLKVQEKKLVNSVALERDENKLAQLQLEHDENKLAQLQAETHLKDQELVNLWKQKDSDVKSDPAQVKMRDASIEQLEKEITLNKDNIAKNKITIAETKNGALDQEIKTLDQDIKNKQNQIQGIGTIYPWTSTSVSNNKEKLEKELTELQTQHIEKEIKQLDQQITILKSKPNISEEDIQGFRQQRKGLYERWSNAQSKNIDLERLEKTSADNAQIQSNRSDAIKSYLDSSRSATANGYSLPSATVNSYHITSTTIVSFFEYQQKELELAEAGKDKRYQEKRLKDAKGALQNPFTNKVPPYLSNTERQKASENGEIDDVFAALKKIKVDAKNRIKKHNSGHLETQVKALRTEYDKKLNISKDINSALNNKKSADDIKDGIENALKSATAEQILKWIK